MRLINDDCINAMNTLIDEDIKVDLILTDPPYGTVKGLSIKGWDKQSTQWDTVIPSSEMFDCCEKLLRMGGVLVLFSQEPYTSYLRQFNQYNLSFIYPYYWLKNHFANNLQCNVAPVSYIEDLSVFRKKYDTDNSHPLRAYAQNLLKEMGVTYKDVEKRLGHSKAEHFLYRINSTQFTLCTEDTYNELINVYHINEYDCFKEYSELKNLNESYKGVFNKSKAIKSNVLQYKKPSNHFHPTEKPVDLLKDLIKTYTNKGDVVLDFTMGSGSTGVACKELGRDFIGIELDENYFKIAEERIYDNQERLI